MSGELKTSDFEVPAASVNRLIKAALNDNIQMTKDARAAFVRAISVFIFYITHGANDFSREAKRQTIFPNDIINALKELGFDDFERPLEEFLEAYRRESAKGGSAKKKSTGKDLSEGDEGEEMVEDINDDDVGVEEMEED
mmetsp:Transcript_20271/g.22015  ORF Transcript_20271/g.22015 Transcript_20271/m.22015 type:complete len:140 (-) Transcript_20271:839-1258(-)|eukprot:gene1245-1321_t